MNVCIVSTNTNTNTLKYIISFYITPRERLSFTAPCNKSKENVPPS